jgi:polyphosphate glucokinase
VWLSNHLPEIGEIQMSINTLAIDIGGTGLKASVLNASGEMIVDRVRVATPKPCPPDLMIETLRALVAPLPEYHRISVGFPGVVRDGTILTAPNLGTEFWSGFNLASGLSEALGSKPIKVINDADMQGLAAIKGKGVEMVITLGTGFGTGIYVDGKLGPHLEMAHHPFYKGATYDKTLGNANRAVIGNKKWRKRVVEAIHNLNVLTNFDQLYIGGGNAKRLEGKVELADNITLIDNKAGILGGIKIWED